MHLGIYKQALEELSPNVVDDIKKLQRQREAKVARVFMDAWSKAGNIALTRAHFEIPQSLMLTKRDR